MPRKQTHLIVLIVAALAVGAASAEDRHEEHAHRFAKDVDAFHSALAPLWHMRAGKERTQSTCAQAAKLGSLAKAIQSANAKPLVTSVAALEAQCQTNPTDIDTAFAQVHDAFHRLAEPGRH
jgi:hypothetical protein